MSIKITATSQEEFLRIEEKVKSLGEDIQNQLMSAEIKFGDTFVYMKSLSPRKGNISLPQELTINNISLAENDGLKIRFCNEVILVISSQDYDGIFFK